MRMLWVILLLALSMGCSRKQKLTVYPGGPVALRSPYEGDRDCVDRLLYRSRYTGYIEQTVDKQMQFFRVFARNKEFSRQLDKKGRALQVKLQPGQVPATIHFYNVQCTGPETALITPMNERGPLNYDQVMDAVQRMELDRYAASIGIVETAPMTSEVTAQPLPPPPPATR
jgi:hypothetical protein